MIRSIGTSGISDMKLNKTSISIDNTKISNSNKKAKTDNLIDMGIQYGCGSAMYGCGAVIKPTMTSEELKAAFNRNPWDDPKYREQRVEEMRRRNEELMAEEEEDVSFLGCVWDTVSDYGSVISDAYDATASYVSDTVDTVSDFYDYTVDYTSDRLLDAEEKIDDVIDEVDMFVDSVKETVTDEVNWILDPESWKRVGATIANASLSLLKGGLSIVEGIGDAGLVVIGGIGSIFTFTYDMGHLLFTDELGHATDKWTELYTDRIKYGWVDDIDKTLQIRQSLDEYSYDFFDSDGTGAMIAEGTGEALGFIGMTVATGGAAPVALASVAGVTGLGKHTEETFNEEVEQNVQQEAYRRLQNVEITQEMYDNKLAEMKSKEDREYTQEEVLNELYNDLYIQ